MKEYTKNIEECENGGRRTSGSRLPRPIQHVHFPERRLPAGNRATGDVLP